MRFLRRMAGENVQQYFLKDQLTGQYCCIFCNQKYAKGSSVTRLRSHLTLEAKTGARRCPLVSPFFIDSLTTESRKTQKALPDNFPSSFAQLGLQSAFPRPMDEVIQDYVPVQNYDTNFEPGQTSGNIVVEDYVIDEYMPPCLEDQTNEDTAEAAAYIETCIETCSLSNDGWISDHYQKSLEDQTNGDTMVENESNLQHGEIARSMEGTTPENQTGSNRVSPTADVLTDEADQNGVQSGGGRVHVEVPSAEVSRVQRTQREGNIVQRSNKRQRSMPDALPIAPEVEVLKDIAKGNIAMDDRTVMRHLRNDNEISWVCRFCDLPFEWDVLPETIRHHLTRRCESAPEDVKEAAQRIEEEAVEAAEFSASVEGSRTASTSVARTASRSVASFSVARICESAPEDVKEAAQRIEEEAVEADEFSASVEGNDSNFKAKTEGSKYECQELQGVEEEVSSTQKTRREGIVQSSNKRHRSMPNALPIAPEVEVLEGIQETGESASLTNMPVGDAFGRNVEKIWSWLMDDLVLRVGICGMGGVGKTTLMRHIQTRLKGQSSLKVFWVTVSQDFSIWKLQDLIAKKIDLKFLDKEDEVERAEKLTLTLKAKGKCVLILDDLWNYFYVDEVGIPVGVNTCKLVLTTRLLKVCHQMGCSEGNRIQLQRLSEKEAWILFTQELGNYGTEVEELAKTVSRECAGLPLGIRVMARSMKGICNVHTWRNTLEELKESKVSKGHEMREEVFSVLKFSYLRLNDPALQECLSYCALFPEDAKIDRNDLIEYMIVEGIIVERKSRQAELDKGHTMLDTLENACLLEGDTKTVWMHDLIRDMLIHELREGSKTLVNVGEQLKELPDVEKWTENLVRVSLISNDIEVIPSGHTPRCPNLSTLLLCTNPRLKMIADSFFEQFQKLKILDLTWCDEIEKLPRSISDLVNLTALLLRRCRSLIHVPSLAKLEKLKKLDLRGCERLKHMPEGVKFLLNLKHLDLSGSGIEERGSGIIPMLSRLQVLKLCNQYEDSKFSIRGSEVGELRMLETLYCRFSDPNEFVEYVKSRERSQQSPSDYFIFIAEFGKMSAWPTTKLGSRKLVSVTGDNFIVPLALPTDVEALIIYKCYGTLFKRLFPPSLQQIHVFKWRAIEEIFAINEGENGEWSCPKLKKLFPPFSNYSTHSLSNHSLLNLKLIDISYCDKLKKLFPPCLLPNLHNLQNISVCFCIGMEEIFSTDQEEEDGQELLFDPPNLTGLHLSRLTTLRLGHLPELRSIYKGAIICHSLQQIAVVNCPKLKRITLPLPQPSLQRFHVFPNEWWDSVQWGSVNDKNHLESLRL